MEYLIWAVKPAGPPKLAKTCGKCGHMHFICSGQFRVNANGSRIDVWLIWKCERCKATWNMDILSRVSAGSIGRELYRRFLENDDALALHYALNKQTLRQNGVVADSDTFLFEVDGKVPQSGIFAQVSMAPIVPLGVNVAKVIAQKLVVSQSTVRRLVEEGLLECRIDIRKKKLCEPYHLLCMQGGRSAERCFRNTLYF